MNKIHFLIASALSCTTKLIDQFFPRKKDRTEKDIAQTIMSSSLLQVSEFRFFELSYSRWYGRDLSEKRMEYFFSDYMMRRQVPYWVRHLSREVQSQYFKGTLDPYEYNIQYSRPSHELSGPIKFLPVFLSFAYLIFYFIFSGQITLH
jgi:hypothetical protein